LPQELRSIALDISAAVCHGSAALDKQLQVNVACDQCDATRDAAAAQLQDSERLDTYRRKLVALRSVPATGDCTM